MLYQSFDSLCTKRSTASTTREALSRPCSAARRASFILSQPEKRLRLHHELARPRRVREVCALPHFAGLLEVAALVGGDEGEDAAEAELYQAA